MAGDYDLEFNRQVRKSLKWESFNRLSSFKTISRRIFRKSKWFYWSNKNGFCFPSYLPNCYLTTRNKFVCSYNEARSKSICLSELKAINNQTEKAIKSAFYCCRFRGDFRVTFCWMKWDRKRQTSVYSWASPSAFVKYLLNKFTLRCIISNWKQP